MILVTGLSAVICLAVWIPISSTAGILVFTVIFGFSSGGFISLGPTLIASLCELKDIGTRIGGAFAIQSIGALIGSPIAGAIVDSQGGDYLGLQLFCGLAMLLGMIFFIASRYVQVGFKVAVKI
jgi:MFS family permease